MLGKACDSGYGVNHTEGKLSRSPSYDYLINPAIGCAGDATPSKCDGTRKCLRLSTDLITPKMTVETKLGSPRMTGSSCQALRHAVAALNRLDDFVCEKIGSGFFSEVFKVTHRTTGQVMVLKMNQLRSNRPNMLKEVQLMNQLSHPHILGFMGVCVHEGQLHALTEYINGGSLEQLNLNKSIELSHLTRMHLAVDIALGVEYLHSRGVFHRDLTSKNVLIRKNEETGEMTAVVGDFGLAAKIPDPKSGYRLPTVGSPYWMSPECLKGQWYDQKTDVFSYGIVLCELIARCEADPDVLPRTENFGLDYLAFADMCPSGCPPGFLKLAFLCCNLEPKSRPSFEEIVRRLRDVVSDHVGHTDRLDAPKIAARSEEVVCRISSTEGESRHKKLSHRRSLSEEVGCVVFPPHTAPSDKARCHFLVPRVPSNPGPLHDIQSRASESLSPAKDSVLSAKHVGQSMLEQDPHYKPTPGDKANPFAALAQFQGVRKILGDPSKGLAPSAFVQGMGGDLFSSCFELPSTVKEGQSSVAETDLEVPDKTALGQEDDWLEKLSWKHPKPRCPAQDEAGQPTSLPSSPTQIRRRLCVDDAHFAPSKSPRAPPPCDTHFGDKRGTRVYSSTVNLADVPDESTSVLKRRGSCESGFFSSVGEDFAAASCDLLSPEFPMGVRSRLHDTSSATLSSSSATSSLFLLDDSATTVSSLRSGSDELADLDDLASQGGPLLCRPHHSVLFAAKRSSSIYTDSSEDISSLGGDLYWEELGRSGAPCSTHPQQISKMVEYFERKQTCAELTADNTRLWGIVDTVPRLLDSRHQRDMLMQGFVPRNVSPVEFARRMEGASLNDAMRNSRITHLRRSLEKTADTAAAANSQAATTGLQEKLAGCVRRNVNATQRLMICEGAVKSKLPLFDRKKL